MLTINSLFVFQCAVYFMFGDPEISTALEFSLARGDQPCLSINFLHLNSLAHGVLARLIMSDLLGHGNGKGRAIKRILSMVISTRNMPALGAHR